MLRLLSLMFLWTTVVAFAPIVPTTTTTTRGGTSRWMFSGDEPKPLEEVGTRNAAASVDVVEPTPVAAPAKAVYRNLGKGGEEVEVPWIDDAMRANTNPLEMSWWAYILFGLPVVLLTNDFLHFLPKDGPLGFLSTL